MEDSQTRNEGRGSSMQENLNAEEHPQPVEELPADVIVLTEIEPGQMICCVPIRSIFYDELHVDTRKQCEDVKGLARSRKTVGQLHPLTAWWDGKCLKLISGYDRLAADILNGRTEVTATVYSGISETEAIAIELAENNRRRDADPVQKAAEIAKEDELLKKLGHRRPGRPSAAKTVTAGHELPPPPPMTPAERKQAERAKVISKRLIPAGKDALVDGKITKTVAIEVGKLPTHQQAAALKTALAARENEIADRKAAKKSAAQGKGGQKKKDDHESPHGEEHEVKGQPDPDAEADRIEKELMSIDLREELATDDDLSGSELSIQDVAPKMEAALEKVVKDHLIPFIAAVENSPGLTDDDADCISRVAAVAQHIVDKLDEMAAMTSTEAN